MLTIAVYLLVEEIDVGEILLVEEIDVEEILLVEEIDAYYRSLPQDTKDCDIPITSIHNLVGTALVACSVTPLDLSSIQRLLPNNTQEKLKLAAITIANFQAYMHSVTLYQR